MDNQRHSLMLSILFHLLAKDPEVRMTQRRSLVLGARELGLGLETLNTNWRAWRSQVPASGPDSALKVPEGLDQDTAVLVLACLVHEDQVSPVLREETIRMLALAGLESRAVRDILGSGKKLARLPLERRMVRLREILGLGPKEAADPLAEIPRPGLSVPGLPANGLAKGRSADGAAREPYIANQVGEEGFDELQALVMARHLGINVAIDGPPGVGKTQSVLEVAALLGQELFTKTCSSRSTESHLISSPVLASDGGATVTAQANGPLCQAMEAGGIFYGDEFNLLKEDVQKRLNSAFDERRSIDRTDGQVVQARPGFWSVISYNPSTALSSRDLDDSVADRFVHLHFRRWDADFKAWVALARAKGQGRLDLDEENRFGIPLAWRGMDPATMDFAYGQRKEGRLVWHDFFTHRVLDREPAFRYLVCDNGSLARERNEKTIRALDLLAAQAYDEETLARLVARFSSTLISLCTTGDSPMLKKLGLGNLREKEDLDLLRLHETSARIEIAAARHYRFLVSKGCNRYLAQSYSVRLVVDQACYGQYRDRKLREVSAVELVTNIARSMRLIALGAAYNTAFSPEKLLARTPADDQG